MNLRWKLAALMAWCWTAGVFAQVQIDLVMDQDQYLPGEALMVAVKITNLSGQDLVLGQDEDWLRFTLEARDSLPMSKQREVSVVGEFKLPSSQVATKVVNLTPAYPLTKPGKYRLVGLVYVPQWKQEFVSRPRIFDIVIGSKLWQQEFGVPTRGNQTSVQPEVRKYALQKAIYLKRLQLYLRLTNPNETEVFRVFSLGTMVSFSQPEAQIDKNSNLHVLCQSGAKSFFYCVVDPDGRLLQRQTHSYLGGSRPILRANADGLIQVFGGMRTPKSDDYPPSEVTDTDTNAVPSQINPSATKPALQTNSYPATKKAHAN
jgi:hypothetical protein